MVKICVPYCCFFVFSAVVFVAVGDGEFNLKGMLYAFFFGNEPLLDKYVGFNFLWFLPSIFSLMILKSVWFNSKPMVRYSIVLISIVLWILAITKFLSRFEIGNYIPFATSQAFYFILLGLISRFFAERQNKWQLPIVILLIGICTVVLRYVLVLSGPRLNVYTLMWLVMPILMFLLLYNTRVILVKSKTLQLIGTYSLQIYLVHVYVINLLSLFALHYAHQSIGLGLIIYVLALVISVILSFFLVKTPIVRKLLFPN